MHYILQFQYILMYYHMNMFEEDARAVTEKIAKIDLVYGGDYINMNVFEQC